MAELALEKLLAIRRRDFPELDKKLLEDVYDLLKSHAHDEEPERSMNRIEKLVEAHVAAPDTGV